MAITLDNIKLLREKCGVGMIDCKKALEEADGNTDKAIEILRKKGIAKAAKRSGMEANEGIIKAAVNKERNEGYIVEINAETDFVARNEQFQGLAEKLLGIIEEHKPENQEALLNLQMDNETVQEGLDSLSGTIGEKMAIKRFAILASQEGLVEPYSHMGGKIGVLVAINKKDEDLAHNVAMQIAAANPQYIKPDDVPTEEIAKEKEIYRAQLLKEGKPENIIDKILEGKIKRYFAEVCLIEQEYIKDDKKSVRDILGEVEVEGFVRYSL